MKHCLLVTLVVLLFTCSCSPAGSCGGASSSLHVLFIGNSYTYVNDLPGMFTNLACSGGHKVETGMAAEGGWTLAQHAASPQTLEKLNQQKWDFVVLQEQSEIPAIELQRSQIMYPAARLLVGKIKAAGALPVFFMTWGHRDGTPYGPNNYNDMQTQLYNGYMGIARELGVAVAPVGYTWRMGQVRSNPLGLWQDDGSHPNTMGTYLAACVFYAALFHQSPAGLNYRAGLSQADAQTLQDLAADSTIKEQARWNPPF